jgi:hypothetical protein
MTEPGKNNADPLELLTLFQSGILTVKANGLPVMKLDGGERSLDLETQGIKECGIKLSKFMEVESRGKGIRGVLSASEGTAKRLSNDGWSLAIYDRGTRILKMGRGVSRLTGHIEVNLLKLRSILENL